MSTNTSNTTPAPAPDAWRDHWVDADTARINARRDEIQHDADDMASYYAAARAAVS